MNCNYSCNNGCTMTCASESSNYFTSELYAENVIYFQDFLDNPVVKWVMKVGLMVTTFVVVQLLTDFVLNLF